MVLAGSLFLGWRYLWEKQPRYASVRIDSIPRATVYLDDREVGQTPYFGERMAPGEYRIKLLPGFADKGTFSLWETKVRLTAQTLTYVARELGDSEETSGGQILTLEKLAGGRMAQVAVVSTPDGVQVAIDGLPRGKTPLFLSDLGAGDHEVVVSRDGFGDQVIRGRVVPGYRLNVVVKLARVEAGGVLPPELTSPPEVVATSSGEPLKPYVVIKETPTGFLRVRADPETVATEVGRVIPGEKYSLQEEIFGWVRIKLATYSGWVSEQYIEKVR